MADLNRMTLLWFAKAEQDLITAKALLDLTSEHFEAIVFHCQQSVEKSIKGYLAFHKVRFQKTHDIEKLLELVTPLNSNLAKKFEQTKEFTKYATAYRYPEEVEQLVPLNKTTATEVYQLAKRLYLDFNEASGLI